MWKTLIRLIYIIVMYYAACISDNMYMLVFSIGLLMMMYLDDISNTLRDIKNRKDDKS